MYALRTWQLIAQFYFVDFFDKGGRYLLYSLTVILSLLFDIALMYKSHLFVISCSNLLDAGICQKEIKNRYTGKWKYCRIMHYAVNSQ